MPPNDVDKLIDDFLKDHGSRLKFFLPKNKNNQSCGY